MRIVCIEDQQDVLALERTILLDAGHTVIAPVVYSWLYEDDFWFGVDIALVDLNLSGPTTGREILAWLAEHMPNVRRVCITGENVTAEEVQAHHIIVKPFTLESLIEAVEQ